MHKSRSPITIVRAFALYNLRFAGVSSHRRIVGKLRRTKILRLPESVSMPSDLATSFVIECNLQEGLVTMDYGRMHNGVENAMIDVARSKDPSESSAPCSSGY